MAKFLSNKPKVILYISNTLQIALDAVYKGAPSCHYQSDYGTSDLDLYFVSPDS